MECRALATIATIDAITPIPDADAISCARIRGWDVVVRNGEFSVGDLAVYVEVDAFLPLSHPRFVAFAPRGVRKLADGTEGHVLKTVKLRGQLSQGLALPVSDFAELGDVRVGDDVTVSLGIVKWEPPVPACLAGQVRGARPSWIPKSDEDRIQNIPSVCGFDGTGWVATEKIDGSSLTIYVDDRDGTADGGVCSRNVDLIESDVVTGWRIARSEDLHAQIAATWPGRRAAVQGELFGEGIQKNPLQIRGQRFAVFAVIVDGQRVPRDQWPTWLSDRSVPVLDVPWPGSVEDALAAVDGMRSMINRDRPAEGVVWVAATEAARTAARAAGAPSSFKVISNRYLLKHDR